MRLQVPINTIYNYFHIAFIWLLLGFIVGGYQGYNFYLITHPIPIPPVPPGPGPAPTPGPAPIPTPTPTPPKPAPIVLNGFSVLILYESSDLSKYPKEQMNILYDQNFRKLLDTYCTNDSKTNTKQYRIWDKDVIPTDSKEWQDVMKRPHLEMPWIVISNGKTGTEEVLPKNVADATTLVKTWFAQTQW